MTESSVSGWPAIFISSLIGIIEIEQAVVDELEDLRRQAEAAAIGRCQATGLPGIRGPIGSGSRGWTYTLAPEVRSLDAPVIRDMIHPHKDERPA